jgi:hypothetical protein
VWRKGGRDKQRKTEKRMKGRNKFRKPTASAEVKDMNNAWVWCTRWAVW